MPLSVEHLHKSFPTRSGELSILRDVSLHMNAGDALAILGPSGSGKSTFLHILGTLDRPTSGTYHLDEDEPFKLDDKALARFRNLNVGFIFQDHHLLPQCTVLENVLVPSLANPPSDPNVLFQRARHLLERVGLQDRMDHRSAELSGGERQRVAVARALLLRPKLLLADEPTGNLDRKNAHLIGELLLEMHRAEATMLIVVTHSLELALTLPRQVEVLDGRLEPMGGARS